MQNRLKPHVCFSGHAEGWFSMFGSDSKRHLSSVDHHTEMRVRPSYDMILCLSLSIQIIHTLYTAQSKHIVQPRMKQQVSI